MISSDTSLVWGHILDPDASEGLDSGIGGVVVRDGRITAVGSIDEVQEHGPFHRTYGSEGHAVLPGFMNAHHHIGSTLRSGLPDAPFEFRNLFLHLLHPVGDEKALYRRALYSCGELLQAGVTSVLTVFYPNWDLPAGGADVVLEAFHASGIRVGLAIAQRDQNLYTHMPDDQFLSRFDPSVGETIRSSSMGRYSSRSPTNSEYVEFVRDLHDRWHGRDRRVFIHVGPDWLPACSEELLRESHHLALDLDTRVQMHLMETPYELDYAQDRFGRSGVEYLADIGFLTGSLVAAHSVWLSASDLAIYADHDVAVAHNPSSNLRLNSGVAPLREMLEADVRVAIGMDGLAFADNNDIFAELRLAGFLQRLPRLLPERNIRSRDLFQMGTRSGLLDQSLVGSLGRLAPGFLADIVLLDIGRLLSPYAAPGLPLLDLVFATAQSQDVDVVLIAGSVVVDTGEVHTVDMEAIGSEIQLSQARSSLLASPEAAFVRDEVEPQVRSFLASMGAAEKTLHEG